MQAIKDKGLELHDLIGSLGKSRELSLAATKTGHRIYLNRTLVDADQMGSLFKVAGVFSPKSLVVPGFET